MLKRSIEKKLEDWKNNKNKKVLMIKGARQVGKTTSIRNFASNNYKHVIELNFVTNPSYKQIFDNDLDATTILANISLFTPYGNQLVPEDTLLFLDEIQECPRARAALKFLCDDGRYDVITSGSMLGINYQNVPSYPTGYVDYLDMYPLSFEEYLWANNVDKSIIAKVHENFKQRKKVEESINNKLLTLFREYIVIGGMPAAVQNFIDEHNFAHVLNIQKSIVIDYKNDIAKYAPSSEKVKAKACYESIPAQLAKENKKFMYNVIEKNGRSSKFLGSIDWVLDANIALKCNNVKRIEKPLYGFKEEDSFKIYMNDTGLLISQLDEGTNKMIINGDLQIYKGAIFENAIAQILKERSYPLYYYRRDSGLEIDFILSNEEGIIPLEVKAGNNKSRSLQTVLKENNQLLGIKLIDGNVGIVDNLLTLPLYMAMFL